jgi:hypothetical protein
VIWDDLTYENSMMSNVLSTRATAPTLIPAVNGYAGQVAGMMGTTAFDALGRTQSLLLSSACRSARNTAQW